MGKYYWKYVAKHEVVETVWPATIIGEAVHLYLSNLLLATKSDWNKIQNSLKNLNLEKLETNYNLQSLPTIFKTMLSEIQTEGKRVFKKSRGWKEEDFYKNSPKWLWQIVKFIYKRLDTVDDLLSEHPFQFTVQIPLGEVNVRGVIDLVENGWIGDFKTVKDSSHYYFIDWTEDTQSIVYLEAYMQLFGKPPKGFSYFVFNENEKTIIVNNIAYPKDVTEYRSSFLEMMNKFLIGHSTSSNPDLYNPEKTKCFFCDYKQICSKAILT